MDRGPACSRPGWGTGGSRLGLLGIAEAAPHKGGRGGCGAALPTRPATIAASSQHK